MNPVSLAQSFLMDIACLDDRLDYDTRVRARRLARELEPFVQLLWSRAADFADAPAWLYWVSQELQAAGDAQSVTASDFMAGVDLSNYHDGRCEQDFRPNADDSGSKWSTCFCAPRYRLAHSASTDVDASS
jgi:hypothetical protein